MIRCGHKQGEFGENRPSQIPIGVNPNTGETEPLPGRDLQVPPDVRPHTLNERDAVRDLRLAISRNAPAIAGALGVVWLAQAQEITAGDIATAGLSGPALNRIRESYETFGAEKLTEQWQRTAAAGASNVEPGIVSRFGMMEGILPDVALPGIDADQWIRARRLDLVQRLTDEQMRASRKVIQAGLDQGLNSNVIARRLRPSIGLTSREAASVEKLRAGLIRSGVSESNAATAAGKKARRLLKVRAKRIAVTESTWAYNMGQLDAVKAYRDAGWFPPNVTIAKVWRKVLPVQECFCEALDGQILQIDSTFPGATPQVRNILTPPAHPNCACVIDIVVLQAGELAA